MSRKFLMGAGIALCSLDRSVSVVLRRRPPVRTEEKLDKTGRVTGEPVPLAVETYPPDVRFVHYPGNFAHSMWRSQELSLLSRHKDLLARPRMDFGCGDGSFASLLFDRIDYGLDIDPEALRVARRYRVYGQLACIGGGDLPIRPKSLRSVFSNSVLEHVGPLEESISGVRDALVPGGYFLFTVPVASFASNLARFFGREESQRINRNWYHRHMHPAEWWGDLLRRHGFDVVRIQPYQPDWFTLAYFALSTRPFRLLYRFGLAGNGRYRRMLARMVSQSIANGGDGDNIFVIARRPE